MEAFTKVSHGTSINRNSKPSGQVMLITADRIAYVGLAGKPKLREFGALTVYISLGAPIQVQVGHSDWKSADLFVVAPDTPHRIETSDQLIGVLMIETETIDFVGLPDWLQQTGGIDGWSPHLASVRCSLSIMGSGEVNQNYIRENFDQFFFGQCLRSKEIDYRLVTVIDKISNSPFDPNGAEECAHHINLSFSRFLHLFKEDVGMPFRRFRAWKRARNFLCYVNMEKSLTNIAFEIGYADSSHFSHSVRHYWGLTAREIIAGSSNLTVFSHHREEVRFCRNNVALAEFRTRRPENQKARL